MSRRRDYQINGGPDPTFPESPGISGVARMTVDGYFKILEDTLPAYRLRADEAGLRVRERKQPKFFVPLPDAARSKSLMG